MLKNILNTCIILCLACIYCDAQIDFDSVELDRKAVEYLKLAKKKSDNYGKQDSIFYYLFKAKNIFQNIGNDSMSIECDFDLIYWNVQQRNYEIAIDQIDSLKTKIQNDKNWKLRLLFNQANIYSKTNLSNRDSSLYYSLSSYESATSLKDTFHAFIGLQYIFNGYLEFQDSLFKIPSVYEKIVELKDYNPMVQNLYKVTEVDMGRYYLNINQPEKAILYLENQSNLLENNNDFAFTKWANDFLAKAYAQNNQNKKAFELQLYSASLADSIANLNKIEAIQKVRFAFDTEKKEKEIAQLKKLNFLKQKTSTTQKRSIIILIVSLILILILMYILYKSLQAKRASDLKYIASQQEFVIKQTKMFTNISHEFRTPLTIIGGLSNKIENLGLKKTIKRNTNQMLSLVEQLLDLSKADAGLMNKEMVQLDIVNFLKSIVVTFMSYAEQKEIDFIFNPNIDRLFLDIDKKKLTHVCNNLISNAIKFTNRGGNVYVELNQKNDQILIVISDSGIGIPESDLAKIFDRFYQSTNSVVGGTGIGLALTKEIIHLLNGEIFVESSLGNGTKFTVMLPISNTADIDTVIDDSQILFEDDFEVAIVEEEIKENQKIVLLIEDNIDLQGYISQCLKTDFKVETASNGEEGLQKALKLIPDIIISDVMMPKMSGYELCKAVKSDIKTNHVPVVLLTAKASQQEKVEGLNLGADAYIVKPFDEEELLIRINQLIELRETLKSKYNSLEQFVYQKPTDPFLEKLNSVLEKNYENDNFNVSEFALEMHFSRMQLHRKMKSITGKSCSEFIRDFRLEKSKIKLINSDDTIAEIAYQCGFNSDSYFIKVFKENYKLTPNQWRNSVD